MTLKMHFQMLKADTKKLICDCITFISIAFGFIFPNGIARLGESCRDLGTSLAYYFQQLFKLDYTVRPTVIDMPTWELSPDKWELVTFFPYTFEEFKELWRVYWQAFITKENIVAYFAFLGDVLFYISRYSVFIIPVFLLLTMALNKLKTKHVTQRGKKSKALIKGEKFTFKYIYPAVAKIKDLVCYIKENDSYYKSWLVLWLIHFNIFTIVIEGIAFYLFFCASWNPLRIYDQLLKLQIDLSPMIRFIPGIAWACTGVKIYNHICRSMGFARLYYYERCNRKFLEERGIANTVYGKMGRGKTQMITSMALSSEIKQWDDAFEIMLEMDLMFPNFPWQRLRDELKKRIDRREIVDFKSCRKLMRHWGNCFDRAIEGRTVARWQKHLKRSKNIKVDYTFGYDFDHYATTYNNELEIVKLYKAIEDYACAYIVFTVKTTLIFANYSIRVDSIIKDLGNMPLRDNDFFHRDPRFQDAYSRHAHIIDMDMLRLGKKFVFDNPKARTVSFGVHVITEVDKERKNTQELKEVKINEKECNQKNDLFNACVMMIRHAVVIANRVFIILIFDLQRPEAWGAAGRELGDVINIEDKGELSPVLPILSPYWICHTLFKWVKKKWDSFYTEYIHHRSDNTLLVHCLKNIIAKINNHYDKVEGQFGKQTLKLELQDGKMEGKVIKDKWRILVKKDRAKRYKTACLEAVFDSYKPNTMHIDDFQMYASEVGSQEENELQNSYFQTDIINMKKLNIPKEEWEKVA